MAIKLDIKINGVEESKKKFNELEEEGFKLDTRTKDLILSTQKYTESAKRSIPQLEAQQKSFNNLSREVDEVSKATDHFIDSQGRLRENNGRFAQGAKALDVALKMQKNGVVNADKAVSHLQNSMNNSNETFVTSNTLVGDVSKKFGSLTTSLEEFLSIAEKVGMAWELFTDTEKLKKIQSTLYLLSKIMQIANNDMVASVMDSIANSMNKVILASEKVNEFAESSELEKLATVTMLLYGDLIKQSVLLAGVTGVLGASFFSLGKELSRTGQYTVAISNLEIAWGRAFERMGKDTNSFNKIITKNITNTIKNTKSLVQEVSRIVKRQPLFPVNLGSVEGNKTGINYLESFKKALQQGKFKQSDLTFIEQIKKQIPKIEIGELNLAGFYRELYKFRGAIESIPFFKQGGIELGSLSDKSVQKLTTHVVELGKDLGNKVYQSSENGINRFVNNLNKIPLEYRSLIKETTDASRLLSSTSISIIKDNYNELIRQSSRIPTILEKIRASYLINKKLLVDITKLLLSLEKVTVKAFTSIFTHSNKLGFIALAERVTIGGAAFLALGNALRQTDSTFLKIAGTISMFIGLISLGLTGAIGYFLNLLGDLIYTLGVELFNVMDRFVEKAQKMEKGAFTFSFTFQGLQREVGNTLGTLKEWESFINKLNETTNKSRDDIQQATAEVLLQGRALDFSQESMEALIKRSADLSEITGDTLFDAVIAVLGGIQGNSRALLKYGMHLSETGIKHSKYVHENEIVYDSLSANERALVALNVMLEQSSVVQGKATQTTATMSAITEQLNKRIIELQANLGKQGFLIRKVYLIFSDFIGLLNKLPPIFHVIVGSLLDFASVTLIVVGALLKVLTLFALFSTAIAVAKILIQAFNIVLMENATVQTFVQKAVNLTSTSLGIQSTVVTSTSSLWVAFTNILRGAVISSFKSLILVANSVIVSLMRMSYVLLTNPIFVKGALFVTLVYGIVRAFQDLEQRTRVFSTLWADLERIFISSETEINLVGEAIKVLGHILKTGVRIIVIAATQIIKGLMSISVVISQLIKLTIDGISGTIEFLVKFLSKVIGLFSDTISKIFKDFSKTITDFFDTISSKMEDGQTSFLVALDTIIEAEGRFMDTTAMAEETTNQYVGTLKKAEQSTYDLETAIVRAEVANHKYQSSFLELQKSIEDYNKVMADSESTSKEKTDARLENLRKELTFYKELDNLVSDNTIELDLKVEKLDGDESISSVQEKMNIELQKALDPLEKNLRDLNETRKSMKQILGESSSEDPKLLAAISKVEKDIARTREKYAIKTQSVISKNREEAESKYKSIVQNNTEKIINEYDKQLNELKQKQKDGYLSVKKYSNAEIELIKKRSSALSEAITKNQADNINAIEEQELSLTQYYDKQLISLRDFNNASKQLELARRKIVEETESKRVAYTNDSVSTIQKIVGGLSAFLRKDLKLDFDVKNFSKDLNFLEKNTKLSMLKLKKEIEKASEKSLETLKELKELELIDNDEYRIQLATLSDDVRDAIKEITLEYESMFDKYRDNVKEILDDTEDMTEENKNRIIDDIREIERNIKGVAGEVQIDLVGDGSAIQKEFAKLDDEVRYAPGRNSRNRKRILGSGYEMLYGLDDYKQFQKMQEEMGRTSDFIISNIKGGTDAIVDTVFSSNLIDKKTRADWAAEAVEDYTDTLGSWFPNLGRSFTQFKRTFTNPLRPMETTTERVLKGFGRFGSFLNNVIAPFSKTITTAWLNLFAQQGWMADTIKFFGQSEKAITQIMFGIKNGFLSLFENLHNNLPYFFSVMGDFFGDFLVIMLKMILEAKIFETIIESLYSGVFAFVNRFLKSFDKYLIQPVLDKLGALWEWIKKAILALLVIALYATGIWYIFFSGVFKDLFKGAAIDIKKTLLATLGVVGVISSTVAFLMSDAGKQAADAVWEFFKGLYFSVTNMFARLEHWLLGVEKRVKVRINRYHELSAQSAQEQISRMDEQAGEALSSYSENLSGGEFKIKTAEEDSEGNKLRDYAENVSANLDSTALNFAESVGDNTQLSLQQAVVDGLNKGYIEFVKMNDFTIGVKFEGGNVANFAEGGFVSGAAKIAGDSERNDIIPALLSAGEYVLPRSITQDTDKMKAILEIIGGKKVVTAATGMYDQNQVNTILAQMQGRGYTQQSIQSIPDDNLYNLNTSSEEPQYRTEVLEGDTGLVGRIGESFKDVFEGLFDLLAEIPSKIGNAVEKGFDNLISEDFWKGFGDDLKIFAENIGVMFKGAFKSIGETFKKLEGAIQKLTGSLGGSLFDLLGLEEIKDSEVFKGLTDLMGTIIALELSFLVAYGAALLAVEAYHIVVTASIYAYNFAIAATDLLLKGITLTYYAFALAANVAWSGLLMFASATWAIIAPFLLITLAIFAVVAVIYLLITYWEDVVGLVNRLVDSFFRFMSVINELFGFEAIFNHVLNIFKYIGNLFINVIKQLGTFIDTLPSRLINSFASAGNIFIHYIRSAGQVLWGWAKKILDKINPGKAVKKATSWVGGLFAEGGWVNAQDSAQRASKAGNDIANDKIPAILSEGEYVLPRSVTQNEKLMATILALISGNTVMAYEGFTPSLPSDPIQNKSSNIEIDKSINITITEEKNININVKSDGKVNIDQKEFRRVILPEIRRDLYQQSKKGTIILSDRGIEK